MRPARTNRYAFHLGSNFFDYPKLAVWPDAYYMAMNVFNSAGTRIWARSRSRSIARRCSREPGDVRHHRHYRRIGRGNVSAGRPRRKDAAAGRSAEHVRGISERNPCRYKVFHFHADFNTPANSTFTLFGTPLAPGSRHSVHDTLVRAAAGTTSSWTRSATVSCSARPTAIRRSRIARDQLHGELGGVAGVRWFELRNVTVGPVQVYQESTYQPDTTWRWMGSAAMDGSGNLAMGFSASSASIFAADPYAGRLATDPLNTLAQGEATLFAGTGSQVGTSSRWGDYSALTVDPVDDCTFWYTTEYYATTSQFNWRTRIGTFKFPHAPGNSDAVARDRENRRRGQRRQRIADRLHGDAHQHGAGAATNVSVSDSPPTGPGISWSIASPSRRLVAHRHVARLQRGKLGRRHQHERSRRQRDDGESCGPYNNTASFLSGNGGQGASGQASTVVTCATGPVAALTTSNSCSVFASGTPTPLSAVKLLREGRQDPGRSTRTRSITGSR
jgi:hypothetical protein